MRRFLLLAFICLTCAPFPAVAQDPASTVEVVWEVRNRFRLFRNETDFVRHVEAHRTGSVLEAERLLAAATDGRGWAERMMGNLCLSRSGFVTETCRRDGEEEHYLAPRDHAVAVAVRGAVPADAECAWTFDNEEDAALRVTEPCSRTLSVRVRHGRATLASVEIIAPDGGTQRSTSSIAVRDLLIAGMGDSIASGEGNPDRAIKLADDGFCFRRFLSGPGSTYFRPGRAGYRGDKSCEARINPGGLDPAWLRLAAGWQSAACHRSLYSYQLRTALALAIEHPHAAVTYLPLACTGASIAEGLLKPQRAREVTCEGGTCVRTVAPQLVQLREALVAARKRNPARSIDLLLLTIGANDIMFSELVADVIMAAGRERVLFESGGSMSNVEQSAKALATELPRGFASLRAGLRTLLDGALGKVVFVTYGNPALHATATPCPGGRHGFDVHPAFEVDAQRLRQVLRFVEQDFFPKLKAMALCGGGGGCEDPLGDRFTFVEGHQPAFADHGFCAQSDNDPAFDLACFSRDGDSFRASAVEAAVDPLTCGRRASEYRPYASRARWVRTANDSYFTAMTFPDGLPRTMQPSDIHDAAWGATSAVYGGAIHPTAEGHAAMADAALKGARRVLGWPEPGISGEPAPPN